MFITKGITHKVHVHLSTKYLAFNKSSTLNIVNVKEHPAISEV